MRIEHNARPHYRWSERGKEKEVSNLQPPSSAPLLPLNLWIFLISQLELCGGLTPISERSLRASFDDTDSHAQISLLAEAAEANANTRNFQDNSVIQPCYISTVCQTVII